MDNNQILDLNLQQISKYNPDLKYKILRNEYNKSDFVIVKTLLQEDNLQYKSVTIHNNYGAESEAKEILEKLNNNKTSITVLYGIGFGYLFKEIVKQANGVVLAFEPNIDILQFTLKNKDLSKELSQSNVFVFSDFNLLKKTYIQYFKYKYDTNLAFLPSYNNLFKQDLFEFANNLSLIMSSCVATNNFVKHNMYKYIKSVLNNIDLLINEPILSDYKDIYRDKTAIIITSDKCLDKNIKTLETIGKYKQNTIIFSDINAIKILHENSIIPDFVGILPTENKSLKFEGLNLSEINAIIEPLTDRDIHNLKFKNIISYPSQSSLPNLIWTTISNVNATPYYSCETVAYTLLQSAQMLGFKDIIIVGQYSLSDILYFDNFAKKYDNLNLYNANLNGTEISGFKKVQIEEFLSSKSAIKRINPDNAGSFDISNIIKNINFELNNADEILKLLKTASTLIITADKEYQKCNNISETFINYFKQILTIYVDMKEIYASKNRLFLYIQQIYSMDLEYELNASSKADSILKIYDLLKIYVSCLISNLEEIKDILKEKTGELNEMLNTKG